MGGHSRKEDHIEKNDSEKKRGIRLGVRIWRLWKGESIKSHEQRKCRRGGNFQNYKGLT